MLGRGELYRHAHLVEIRLRGGSDSENEEQAHYEASLCG